MSGLRFLYLVCYDISEPKILQKVHKAVKAFAVGGQKSFYECWMTQSERECLLEYLGNLIDYTTDRVHIFQLDPRRPPSLFGAARKAQYQPFLIV